MYRKTIEEMEQDMRPKQVIDVRSAEDYARETYPDAENIYWEEFENQIDRVAKDRPVYLLCYTGQHSDEIAENLS